MAFLNNVSQKKEELYGIIGKVSDLESEKEDLLKEKNVTMDILLNYEKDRPVAEKLASTKRELEVITKARDTLKTKRSLRSVNYTRCKISQI